MCAIFGALVQDASVSQLSEVNRILDRIIQLSFERGRDGRGYVAQEVPYGRHGNRFKEVRQTSRAVVWDLRDIFRTDTMLIAGSVIGNMRAEPTTEYVAMKSEKDQQPYRCGQWTIVHNGTIANDKELRTHKLTTTIDSAAIVELLDTDHMIDKQASDVAIYFERQISKLTGSYAILATHDQHPGMILVACNYRPIWFGTIPGGVAFTSSKDYLPSASHPVMLEPYSVWAFTPKTKTRLDTPRTPNRRALVVCSGGLDSVVSAAWAKHKGYDISLVHFQYGSRAEGPEIDAVRMIADYLDAPLFVQEIPIYNPSDSPLLRADSEIAGGEEGAEFAHEWVPARNLVMLSIATAIAEASGFGYLVLGNNLEEAGAYPDNEPEFIRRFNDMLPFAVGDGKCLQVIMPVGNMMKHEIVEMGLRLHAPLHLTWSCYRAGVDHCGTCGPCYMRRTAFEINDTPEVIRYANEEK